jgi:hypothetical protein
MQEMAPSLAFAGLCPANSAWQYRRPYSKRQNGAIAIMFAGSLIAIIGFFGLALDLSRVYNRKAELEGTANTVALAAAKKLDGTSTGISDALAVANEIMTHPNYRPKYNYSQLIKWDDAAIKFSKSPDGSTGWLSASEATSPGDLMYVKVDTNALNPAYGTVNMLFMPALATSFTTIHVSHTAVAGRRRIAVTPLAICAMANTRAGARPNSLGIDELVEYGFRRGVSYDLMNLNSNGTTKKSFLVDPIAPPGSGSSASNFAPSTVGPSVCSGTVALPKVSGEDVSVQSDFPINLLFDHLNSRFDPSNGACDPGTAFQDNNIKKYTAGSGNISWMNPRPTLQTALTDTDILANKLQTKADLPTNTAATNYGPLWAYARPVQWAPSEPVNGYTPFDASITVWNSLYATGLGLNNYPSGAYPTPYLAGIPANPQGIKYRRVLNIPLLECPVFGSTAKVLAIGKFFMTVQATSAILSAEFGGATTNDPHDGPVELY